MSAGAAPSGTAPSLWIVAGANGVGKTTFAETEIAALSGSLGFVNLDLIARGISPLDPNKEQVRAARIAIDLMQELIARRETFSIETTLAGRGHKGLIQRAKRVGYVVHLLYFFVSTLNEALNRIARRVANGGHDVPKADATRRFERSLEQFGVYAELCDSWRVYNTDDPIARLCASGAFSAIEYRATEADLALPEPIDRWLKARAPQA
ncbi:MAG: AAA family ATPase [Hyphomonadaceae bacterium]|nr:AAA family ATPase [Hyphomonadaceae bacterium]